MTLRRSLAVPLVILLTILVGATPLFADPVTGAIFTTTSTGTTVNGNIYPSKSAVYLNGGPQNEHAAGLQDGVYYFQVTDPNGDVLLSTDNVSCRQLIVTGGVVTGSTGPCPHATGTFDASNGSTPVQLIPFNNTPNPGGEYKAWITPQADYDNFVANNTPDKSNNWGFVSSKTKTDNFKIQEPAAQVKVCKFNDLDGNGAQNDSEALLPHWPITATGVVGDHGSGVTGQTADNGCIAFSVTTFTGGDGSQSVTLTEGTIGGWTQTAPADGSCTLAGDSVSAGDTCNVAAGVITVTVNPGDSVNAPNFGNHQGCTDNCNPQPLTVTKTANPSFTRTYTWGISKSVDQTRINTSGSATFNYTVSVTHDSGTDSGWQATGSIRVSNPNATDITGVNVSDAVDNGGSCTVDTSNFNGTVPGNSHVDLPYVCTYEGLPAAGTNTATAQWDSTSATGTANVDFAQATINVVDGSVAITDTLGGSLGTVNYTDDSPKTFTYSQTFTDPAGTCTNHGNTATFTTSTSETTGSDSKNAEVCVGADPTVSKTAAASFTSGITKDVNKTRIEQANGTGTFTYTVTVTESGWAVNGNITVANPNDWESVAVDVADALSDAGGVCVVNGGTTSVVVAPSSSEVLPYTCTFAAAPGASGTNSASATWDAAAAYTVNNSASGSATYAFQALTVTDNFNGTTTTLGTISSPAASTPYTYSHTVTNAIGGQCKAYSNTATISETGQNASQTVNMCNTATGALTIGFWQNKNGQGIITGGGVTGGVCNSATFLRTFTPFQDLTSNTCAGVASYATGIIKAANASGASMNAMLKAQMLATALDAFFSDPSTGNPIHAPTPIGTVKIDLTQVCNMLDGSGGVASCSGSFINVSSAFGGASSMTVGNMLLFQNNVSDVGGKLWYGNVKSTQALAKDVFDAINNQAAYIAP